MIEASGHLTAERVLDAAEDVLRRFGPAKATVVDVARALGVSHAAVYRHFGSKDELRDAVIGRWLHRVADPLGAIARDSRGAPAKRLWRWVDALRAVKRDKALDDPELFQAYRELSRDARRPVEEHVLELAAQLETIVRDGMTRGVFRAGDPATVARAIFVATSPFHKPTNAGGWGSPQNDRDYAAVRELIDASLRP